MTETIRLAWQTPAKHWSEACPLGDGFVGAMAFGGENGRYQVNDAFIWSGRPDTPSRGLEAVIRQGAGPERLRQVRAAIDRGDLDIAEDLLMAFEGRYTQLYLPFVDLGIQIPGAAPAPGRPARELDLDLGTLDETLTVDGIEIHRRSAVRDHTLVIHVDASAPLPDVLVTATTPLRGSARSAGADRLNVDVTVPVDAVPLHEPDVVPPVTWPEDEPNGWDGFASAVVAIEHDGTTIPTGDALIVSGARHIRVALGTASRAEAWWADADAGWETEPQALIRSRAASRARAGLSLASPLTGSVADVSAAQFQIGSRRNGVWEVEELLAGSDDAGKATVVAEYGRYLLSSCSRRGGPAANLQGIWNDQLRPAWSSNYTININTQMNYWAAGPLGLTDAAEPLIALVERLAISGTASASALYGARGWVAHHNTDLWGWSLPVGMGHGAPSWAIWQMGGVWLCHSLWEIIEHAEDPNPLLRRIWPVVRGASLFCLDWLLPQSDGTLRTSPSTSPENMYLDRGGTPRALGLTAAMDIQLIRALLQRTLRTLDALELDDPIRFEILAALERLPKDQIGADGRLLEWSEEVVESEPAHRHLSPLAGVFPLDLIDDDAAPALADAARKTLSSRGNGAMGWSWTWKAALHGRLRDGDSANALLNEAFTPFDGDNGRHGPPDGSEWGGLLPNLFSTHPPFQVDGNLGFPAAIAELLVQSHRGVLRLLPALPTAWPDGAVTGIRTRLGVTVDMTWADGRLERATLRNSGCRSRTVTVAARHHRRIDVVVPAHGLADIPNRSTPSPAPMTASGTSK
jgi:alpha-L-fucosidase 2